LVNFTNLGIIGLAFSVSLANLVQCFGLILFFGRKVNGINWSLILSQFNKILLSSIIMGIVTWVTIKSLDIYLLDTARTINVINIFIASTLLGFISYLISVKLFKVEQLQDYQKYYQKIKNRLIGPVNK
jgi:peptidoglycan biosynthesis protein MviN/MurJ (putative lipid II flippase)